MVQAHVWPSRHHHSLALCLLPHPFFLSLLPPFLSFPLPLPLPLVVVVDEKRQVGRHAIHTPPSPLCLVPCVWWLCGCGVWWCWLARHACMGGTSGCGWCVWPPTHHACGASGASLCGAGVHVPTPFPTHSLTHRHGTPPRHTHTHGWWLVHFGPWCVCVCVGTVLAVAAPGSPLTPPPTPSAPLHSTSPLAAAAGGGGGGCGGGSVGVVACVATWSTHWLCWCCPLPHPHTHTHTGWWARGGGGCVCGVAATTTVRHSHQPPPLCPLPRPVRCVCACACEWWHHAQRRTVVARTLVCG